MDKQVQVIGIGPQKTGSSWLHAMLESHPRLCFPKGVKETFFWDTKYHKGVEWYFGHFDGCASGQLIAEIGPTYFTSEEAAQRLHAHNPDCKIVVTLRDPAERAFSLFLHHARKGRVGGGFDSAVGSMPEILQGSRYATFIPVWEAAFGRSNVHFIVQEDIETRPAWVLAQVCAYLGVEAEGIDERELSKRVYGRSWPRMPLVAKVATRGAEWLRDAGLYNLLGAARKLGLKKMLYAGGERQMPRMDQDLRCKLVREFEVDIAFVESRLGLVLENWRR